MQPLPTILSAIPDSQKQGRRFVAYIYENPWAITVAICRDCAVVNISDCASNVRPYLKPLGLDITCRHPEIPIKNRFGERSNMFEWGLVEIKEKEREAA